MILPLDDDSHGSPILDQPAPPAPQSAATGGSNRFTPLEKRLYAGIALTGLVLLALTVYVMGSSLPVFVIGGMAGGGGAMLAIGIMKLFHRPGSDQPTSPVAPFD